MTGRIAALTVSGGLSVITELDPGRQPFLDHHRIDGTAVLPGVMGMEGFAEAARALLPGWVVVALEDVDLLAPFKFYRDEPRTLELRALVRDGGDGTLVADCQLIGRRDAARPGRAGDVPLHRPRAAGARRAGPAGGAVLPADGGDGGRATTRSTASTSTAPPTRCSTAPGATTDTSSAGWPASCPPTTSRRAARSTSPRV